jgi:hypothetical protein
MPETILSSDPPLPEEGIMGRLRPHVRNTKAVPVDLDERIDPLQPKCVGRVRKSGFQVFSRNRIFSHRLSLNALKGS